MEFNNKQKIELLWEFAISNQQFTDFIRVKYKNVIESGFKEGEAVLFTGSFEPTVVIFNKVINHNTVEIIYPQHRRLG